MTALERYRRLEYPLPVRTLRWQLSHGSLPDLELVEDDLPQPGPDEVLFRVDTNAVCFSDVKVLKNPTGHPRMRGYDLERRKLVPGHETALTIVAAGARAAERFRPGERYLVQADILKTGDAVGYNIWGGMQQFGLYGPTVQEYLIPIPDEVGYSQASLVEPWACVEASYRRADLAPSDRDVLLLGGAGPMGQMHLDRCIGLKRTGRCPDLRLVVVSDISAERLATVESRYARRAADQGVRLVCADTSAVSLADVLADLGVDGFDYIVALCPIEAVVQEGRGHLRKYGVLNLFAGFPRGVGALNMGDLHYDQHTVTGNSGSTVADMRRVMEMTREGALDTNYSVGEVAGFRAGKQAIEHVAGGRSSNKVCIYNPLPDLPLTPVAEMTRHVDFSPAVREEVAAGVWSARAEREMLEQLLELG